MKLVWIHDSNSNSIYDYLNALYLFCPKQRTNIVQTCTKMVQMDSLNFSDNFSYINYLIWSYGWISMIYWSFSYFLEFPDYNKSRNEFTASALRHRDVSRSTDAAGGQTWPVGPTGQWLGLVSAADVWTPLARFDLDQPRWPADVTNTSCWRSICFWN